MNKKGVFTAKKKNGETYFRASMTAGGRHISLGSFSDEESASAAYKEGCRLLRDGGSGQTIADLESICHTHILPYNKIVILLNLRDNGIYLRSPIYIYPGYFYYFLSASEHLTFDKEDLFYYSTRRIMKRGSHLFVADYGMQVTITGRYGIRPFAVPGRDYRFINGDSLDFRYSNIEIINPYHGVLREGPFGMYKYKAVIHLNGNFIIGTYDDPDTAAIAYNKAADLCKNAGIKKEFPVNFIETKSPREYADIYESTDISGKLRDYLENQ